MTISDHIAAHLGRSRFSLARIARARTRTLLALLTAGATLAIAGCGGDGAVAPVGAAIAISPSNPEVRVAETVALVATVAGEAAAAGTVHWSSADPAIATVSESGLVTARSVGTVRIAASSQGQSGETTVRVVQRRAARVKVVPSATALTVGDTASVQLSAFDADDQPLTGRSITLTSATPTVVAVIDGPRVVALSPGSARLTATVEGVSASVDVTVTGAPVATVELIPDSATVAIGGTTRIVAVTRDRTGAIVTDRPIVFSSSSEAVASVAGDGTVIGVAAGRAEVTATAEGVTAKAVIVVPPATAAQLSVTPATATLLLTGTVRLKAVLQGADGKVITGRPVSWRSTNTGAAQVSSTGVVTATGLGVAIIIATSDDLSASAGITVVRAPVKALTVSPTSIAATVGDVRQLVASARDAGGAIIPDVPISWTSSAPGVAVVSSSGEVRALAAGTAKITATAGAVSATTTVTVARAPVASVTVSPTTLALRVGATGELTATPRNAAGEAVPDASVTWRSSNTSVASVSAAGVVKALAVGSATITATSGGKSAGATVTVGPPMVAELTVAPTSLSLATGEKRTLVATARDADGDALPDASVKWTSSAPAIVAVTASGEVTALAVGSAAVTATSDGVSASAAVTVTRPAVASIDLSPTSLALTVGATGELAAIPRDGSGAAVADAAVGWNSSEPTIATVSSTGVVTAMSVGTALITASSEGEEASATVTVAPPPVASVTVAPTTLVLDAGDVGQLVATARDAHGNTVPGATFSWTSSDEAVATVSSSGEVHAVSAGIATMRATSDGVFGTSSITVQASVEPPQEPPTPGAPSRIVIVSGDEQEGRRGSTLPEPLVIRVVDANDVPVPGVVLVWLALDGGLATPHGLVTDADGTNSATWRLGTGLGEQTATALVVGLGTVAFHATSVRP